MKITAEARESFVAAYELLRRVDERIHEGLSMNKPETREAVQALRDLADQIEAGTCQWIGHKEGETGRIMKGDKPAHRMYYNLNIDLEAPIEYEFYVDGDERVLLMGGRDSA